MASELPAAALLDLGQDLHAAANAYIAEFEKANETSLTKEAAETISDLVFPNKEDSEKREVLLGHLLSVVKRNGAPTSTASMELLEKAKAQKELNASTGLQTQEIILAREWASIIIKSQQTLTANEFMLLQNTRANKSDQIAMLPAASQAAIYADAAELVQNGD